MKRQYYLAINQYRSSTDAGRANTWEIYRFRSAKLRNAILREGLPVRDAWRADGTPVCSTMGIRLCDRAEIDQIRREVQNWEDFTGGEVPYPYWEDYE